MTVSLISFDIGGVTSQSLLNNMADYLRKLLQKHSSTDNGSVLLRHLLSARGIVVHPGEGRGILKNGYFLLPGSATQWVGVKFGPSTTKSGDKRHFLLDEAVSGLRNGCGDPVKDRLGVPVRVWQHCSPVTVELLMALSNVPKFITSAVFDSCPVRRKLAYVGNALSDIGGINFAAFFFYAFNSQVRPFLDRHQEQLSDVLRSAPRHGVYLGRYNFNNEKGRQGKPEFGRSPEAIAEQRNHSVDARFGEPNFLREALLRRRLESCAMDPAELASQTTRCTEPDIR